MPASPFDSEIYRHLLHDAEVGKLFSDSAEVRAMLLVEGALAKTQGKLGIIPEESGEFIHRASLELQIDPGGLATETGRSAVPVPALVQAFRKAMDAPEHAQFVHWGATSQDIMDTGLVLRLRQVLTILDARLVALIRALGLLAGRHAHLVMPARTWGQIATPTTFGAVVTSWGQPLLRHRLRLLELKPRLLQISLSGAAGTLSVIGDKGPELTEQLARALGLEKADGSWHSQRDTLAELSGWMTNLTCSLGKMGEDLLLLTHSQIGEVTLETGGGSSTMPQKSNPVLPSLLVTLSRHILALNGAMHGAVLHREQRDGAAWMLEWLNLPQICMCCARALSAAQEISPALRPNPDRMAAHLNDGTDQIYAESLSFSLSRVMPRPDAQKAVKELCRQAKLEAHPLRQLAKARWPELDLTAVFSPELQLGRAPENAENFARTAKTI